MTTFGWKWADVVDYTLPPATPEDHGFSQAVIDRGRCRWCGEARHSGPCLDPRFARQRREDVFWALLDGIMHGVLFLGLLCSGAAAVGALILIRRLIG